MRTGTLFSDVWRPYAQPGQLVAIVKSGTDYPAPGAGPFPGEFRMIVGITPLPTISESVTASSTDLRLQDLELTSNQLAQYRMKNTTASSQVQIKRPVGAPVSNTNTGKFYIDTNTETDWGGTGAMRNLTEFWLIDNDQAHFTELAGVTATVRFSGWKFYTKTVTKWPGQDPLTGRMAMQDLKALDAGWLPLLLDYAGVVPTDLYRG